MLLHNRTFGGLQLVPPYLVPVIRPLLASQGITDPKAISNSGEVDPMALIALGFDKVEIRTAFSSPVTIDLKLPMDAATEARLKEIQPAITFTGRAGRAQIAPYGVPSGISPEVKKWGISIGIGLGAALLGTMLFGGVLFGRRA